MDILESYQPSWSLDLIPVTPRVTGSNQKCTKYFGPSMCTTCHLHRYAAHFFKINISQVFVRWVKGKLK